MKNYCEKFDRRQLFKALLIILAGAMFTAIGIIIIDTADIKEFIVSLIILVLGSSTLILGLKKIKDTLSEGKNQLVINIKKYEQSYIDKSKNEIFDLVNNDLNFGEDRNGLKIGNRWILASDGIIMIEKIEQLYFRTEASTGESNKSRRYCLYFEDKYGEKTIHKFTSYEKFLDTIEYMENKFPQKVVAKPMSFEQLRSDLKKMKNNKI